MELKNLLAHVRNQRRSGPLRMFACVQRPEDITGDERARYVIITGVSRSPDDPLPDDPALTAAAKDGAVASSRERRGPL
jgi:hypothetical protein